MVIDAQLPKWWNSDEPYKICEVMDGLKSLPDGVINCVVTSPPYYSVRDYGTAKWEGGDENCDHSTDWDKRQGDYSKQSTNKGTVGNTISVKVNCLCPKCGAKRVDKQLGLESTPDEYISKMVEVFREVRRVLRDDGVCWINMGDSFISSPPGNKKPSDKDVDGNYGRKMKRQLGHGEDVNRIYQKIKTSGLKHKDLIGMPWRLALALQNDGWYLRSDIIWQKLNPMPESVTDRPTKSHEYIFLLTKKSRYYYDADAIREKVGNEKSWCDYKGTFRNHSNDLIQGHRCKQANKNFSHPHGRNKRDVWTINTTGFSQAHFATFPPEIPEICIKAGCPELVCKKCGRPRIKIYNKGEPDEEWKKKCGADTNGEYHGQSEKYLKQDALGKSTYTGFNKRWKEKQQNASDVKRRILDGMREREFVGYDECDCGVGFSPGIVLDPFLGSGMTIMVANELGRIGLGFDLNPDYEQYIRERIKADRIESKFQEGEDPW